MFTVNTFLTPANLKSYGFHYVTVTYENTRTKAPYKIINDFFIFINHEGFVFTYKIEGLYRRHRLDFDKLPPPMVLQFDTLEEFVDFLSWCN